MQPPLRGHGAAVHRVPDRTQSLFKRLLSIRRFFHVFYNILTVSYTLLQQHMRISEVDGCRVRHNDWGVLLHELDGVGIYLNKPL